MQHYVPSYVNVNLSSELTSERIGGVQNYYQVLHYKWDRGLNFRQPIRWNGLWEVHDSLVGYHETEVFPSPGTINTLYPYPPPNTDALEATHSCREYGYFLQEFLRKRSGSRYLCNYGFHEDKRILPSWDELILNKEATLKLRRKMGFTIRDEELEEDFAELSDEYRWHDELECYYNTKKLEKSMNRLHTWFHEVASSLGPGVELGISGIVIRGVSHYKRGLPLWIHSYVPTPIGYHTSLDNGECKQIIPDLLGLRGGHQLQTIVLHPILVNPSTSQILLQLDPVSISGSFLSSHIVSALLNVEDV